MKRMHFHQDVTTEFHTIKPYQRAQNVLLTIFVIELL